LSTDHARLPQTYVRFGGDNGIDTAHHSHGALTTLARITAPLNGNQGTGASRLNRLAGSVQVQKIAHTIGSHRRLTSTRIALTGYPCLGQPFTVATARRTHK